MDVLDRDFFLCDALTLSEKLLGKVLIRNIDGAEVGGIITETEAYMGVIDKASHAYGGRKTARTESMYLPGGHAYVYLIYGIYSCMNITANVGGNPEAVLIRAVYPYINAPKMYECVKKYSKRKNLPDSVDELKKSDLYKLTNGPGKLCCAMEINRSLDKIDLTKENSTGFCVKDYGFIPQKVERSKRIGIDYAEEAADFLWRFTVSCRRGIPEFLDRAL